MSVKTLKFKHPFTCIVAGGTSSGKTVWTTKIIRKIGSYLIDIKNKKIESASGVMVFNKNCMRNQLKNVEIIYQCGIPNLEVVKNIKPNINCFR